MPKRTIAEVERDYKRIREILNTTPVTSVRAISKIVGLSESQVKSCFSRHPRVWKKALFQMKANRESQKSSKKEETTNTVMVTGYVVDASISDLANLKEILSQANQSSKLILTSITIKELEKLQKISDESAKGARYILAIAAENPQISYSVLIDEDLETPDDCIIKYCADHKEHVVLLTADKSMALKARMYGVETQFFSKRETTMVDSGTRGSKTLWSARKIGKRLFIPDLNPSGKSIMVLSGKMEYTSGINLNLKVGDSVFIASKEDGYLKFEHYKVTFLSAENNCKLVYSKHIKQLDDISKLYKPYKTFMRDFVKRQEISFL